MPADSNKIMPEIPYSKVFFALLVIAGWAITGMLARRFGLLRPKWDRTLLRTVIWCFYPCLILKNVMENKALADEPSLLLTILFIGFFALAIGEVASSIAARWVSFENPRQRNTFIFTTGIFNYGYFAFPVAETLFGQETFGILLVFVTGVEVAIWSVGILYLTSGKGKLDWKRLVNPPIIAVIMALTLNWSGVANSLTPQSIKMLDVIGQLAIPLGLILIGATLFDNLKSLDLRKHMHQVVMACCVRQLFLPSVFIMAAILLPVLPELKAVLVVEAAMPCGIFAIVIAKHYGGSQNTALQIIMGTTVLSVLTIPFWVMLGIHLTGLQELLTPTQ
jgi:predicted permease